MSPTGESTYEPFKSADQSVNFMEDLPGQTSLSSNRKTRTVIALSPNTTTGQRLFRSALQWNLSGWEAPCKVPSRRLHLPCFPTGEDERSERIAVKRITRYASTDNIDIAAVAPIDAVVTIVLLRWHMSVARISVKQYRQSSYRKKSYRQNFLLDPSFNMRFAQSSSLAAGLFGLAMLASAQDTYYVVYQYPNSPYTALENLAVRSNGNILLSASNQPNTQLLDPSATSPQPTVLHTYPDATGTFGITQPLTDLFAIVVGNYSGLSGVPGSFSIWTLDLRGGLPGEAIKVASITEAHSLNGASTVPGNSSIILVADSSLGAIFRVDITNGHYVEIEQNSLLNPTSSFPLGINGIHLLGGTAYFTNSAQGIYGSVAFNTEGTEACQPTIITHALSPSLAYDDFALDGCGNAYVNNHPQELTKITPAGVQTVIVNSTAFDQPTSAAFGTTSGLTCTLYVVTAGTSAKSGAVLAVQAC